ncbi:DUF3344 domain-containing protein, partial [candidate division WOR-3 bacterium]|nr:DUF3344 domain-containing protein [candidate division WOR-3 bacterium]
MVNVSWLFIGTEVQTNESVTEASYTNTNAAVGMWNVSAVATNENGTEMQTWIWNVSPQVTPTPSPIPTPTPTPTPTLTPTPTPSPEPTQILSSNAKPPTPFYIYGYVSYQNGTYCNAPFMVVTNLNTSKELIADNRTGVSFYQLVTSPSFVNASNVLKIEASKNGAPVGNATHTVTSEDLYRGVIEVGINEEWTLPDLIISEISTPPLLVNKTNTINVKVWNNGTGASGAFNLAFSVSKGNETEYENGTRVPGLNRSSYASISFSWEPTSEGSYNITVSADYNHEVNESNELNNNLTMTVFVGVVPDFTVTYLNISNPRIGDVVKINATIANLGVKEGTTNVEFYDNKSIEIKRTENDYFGGKTINDILTLPGVLQIRVHFSHIGAYSNIKIYDKNDLEVPITDNNWTGWASGDTIRIESRYDCTEFTVDRYEAVLANGSVPLSAGNSTNISANWNLSLQEMGWATSGEHNITVIVDPYNQIVESYETNNTKTRTVVVNASLDFAVINISFNTTEPLFNDIVKLNATVANFGDRDGTATLRAYCDELIVNETVLSLNFTDPPRIVDMRWVTNITNGGAGPHNISVEIDPDNIFFELNETNNTRIEQIFVNGTDLAITNIKIPCLAGHFGEPCYRGENKSINVTIANIGALDATNFTIFFMDGLGEGNISGSVFNMTHIQRLNSSENTSIPPVTWTPSEFGKHTITVSIPFDNTDNNEMNNEWFVNVSVKPDYDFSVENVSVYPKRVKEGENVTINATIANLGRKNGSVNVSFYVNVTDFAGSGDERYIEIGRTEQPVYVEVGNTNSTPPISWNANIHGGDHLIYAVVDPDNNFSEWPEDITTIGETIIFKDPSRAGNNVKSCILHVRSPQLNLTNLTLNPPPVIGKKVNVTAVVENKGNETANSTVWFYMEQDVSDGSYSISRNRPGHWTWEDLPVWSVSQPEHLPTRVHFHHIEIKKEPGSNPPWNTTDEVKKADDVITASVDIQPVSFYVKSKDVANGQPIKVPQIDFNSPCDDCRVRNLNGICIDKRWEDVWTEWSEGKTLEVKVDAWDNVNLNLLIDKYQVRLGNRTVTIDAHNFSSYNIPWNASPPLNAGENYTLVANVEDKVLPNKTCLGGTDLAVTNISVGDEILDDNQIWINATIENLGRKNATAFLVNFTEVYVPRKRVVDPEKVYNHTELINVTHIARLEVGNSTNISFVLWNASIRDILCDGKCIINRVLKDCDWPETDADNYTIKVEINPLNNTELEQDETNNYKEARVHVNRSRDFSVTNLSFAVNGTSRDPSELALGEFVTLNATLNITNYADHGGNVSVGFYLDDKKGKEHLINNTFVNGTFDTGNGTVYAELDWHVENFGDVEVPGDHNITVVADPENKIIEINESNNESTWQIHVKAPELTVTDISFDPERPEKGKTVKINVTIANYGDKNATDVTLAIYDWADRHIENVAGQEGYSGPWIEVKRENATAMRLYLDLEIEGGEVCAYDSMGTEIECKNNSFHGWTPWVLGNNITVVANGDARAKVSKVYHLEESGVIDRRTISEELVINEPKTITVEWTASMVCLGERLIAAIIDPGKNITDSGNITEYNELNNTKAEYISVQTTDLAIEDINLIWLNGTQIKENDIIRDNDTVRIIANITNIGENASNFSVRILVDDDELLNKTEKLLKPENLTNVSAEWTAEVGTHVIKVEVDYNNKINETNETNNIEALERYVHGAEVSGNTTWESLGLHGQILFEPSQPYDEDEVNITVNITNSGYVDATDFNVLMFFDYTPESFSKKYNAYDTPTQWKWKNESYDDNTKCVYLDIDVSREYPIYTGDLIIYDGNGTEVARPDESCWIQVPGNAVNIHFLDEYRKAFTIYFYPVYQDNSSWLYEGVNVPVNSSRIPPPPMKRNVTAGNHTITVFIDPENRVPEDNKMDNIISKVMSVLPTRDFVVTNVTAAVKTNLSDSDTTNITAAVANVGYRNGTTRVDFVDYENETRLYNYYFDKNRSLSYLPISPDASVSGYKELTIIHRPGVDAIQLHFTKIRFEPYASPIPEGKIWASNEVCEYKEGLWKEEFDEYRGSGVNVLEDVNIWIPGDTAYIYTEGRASFEFSGYTSRKVFHEENVSLKNATRDESGNITAVWSKDITTMWSASTGDHNITVIIDPDDEISEMNETNNTYVLLPPLSVNATRDLEIVDLNISPLHPDNENNVTINVTVRNKGTKRANFTIDLWMDTLKDSSAAPVPYYNWSMNITAEEKTRYITLLNHTEPELSLAPGKRANVTATWGNISVYGNPTYIVRAIVDPLDEIDELNESNNEMSTEIIMNYPDLTVAGFNSPTNEEKNASVSIENIGAAKASEFNVSLELIKHEYSPLRTGILNVTNDTVAINITVEGASQIRIHFASLETFDEKGYIEIYGKDGKIYDEYKSEEEGKGIKRENVWTEWVKGDTIKIDYVNANFYIDLYGCGNIYEKEGASKMRICFDWLDTRGENSYIDIYEKKGGEEWKRVETYSGVELWSECTPWANGDTILIDSANAYFYIQECWWKEETITTIKALNASESKNVSLPAWKYEGVEVLNVTIDPENKIVEQKEDNNTRTAIVYADLEPKEVGTVFSEDGKLKGINVTILNNKTVEEERGIAFPVYNFSVELCDSSGESIQTKRIGENDTIYGGENFSLLFDVNESVFAANRTYNIRVIADSEDEIEEINENNNEDSTPLGPDISVSEIYTKLISEVSCECYVGAVIKNEGNLPAANFSVRLELNDTIKNETWGPYEENIILLPPNKEETLPFSRSKVEPNKIYDVKIIADPENTVSEGEYEWNNENETTICPDIVVEDIKVPRYLLVDHSSNIEVGIKNTGTVGAKNFNITLYPNAANTTVSLENVTHTVNCLKPGEELHEIFEWVPLEENEYDFTVRADPEDIVEELNKGNNERSSPSKRAFAHLGYEGDELTRYITNEVVRGGIYFEIGERPGNSNQWYDVYHNYSNSFDYGGPSYRAEWNINISNLNPIESRLYLYLGGSRALDSNGSIVPMLPTIDMIFNTTHHLSSPTKTYPDYPVDAMESYGWNYAYGTYCYNVPVNNGDNFAEFTVSGVEEVWIAGMGLLIVYEGGDETLTKYWIDEGADVLLSGATYAGLYTPLLPNETTTMVPFDGCADFYKLGNATLITVVPFGDDDDVTDYFNHVCGGKWGGKKRNGLYFDSNGNREFNDFGEEIEDGAWECDPSHEAVGINKHEVKNLIGCNNLFGIQDRGDFMFSANAFLILTYPPDLVPSLAKVPQEVVVGNQYYVDITNIGRSKAKDFYVRFYVDGEELKDKKQHVKIIEEVESSKNWEELPFPWTAPITKVGQRVELKVAVDLENNVTELDKTNNNATKNVSVDLGGWDIHPGRGGGTGGGWGEGNGTGEGSGSGEGKGVAGGSGEGGAGESGGKTIRGRLMKGTVVSGKEAGGGGKGEFSLVRFLMQLVMLAAAVLL